MKPPKLPDIIVGIDVETTSLDPKDGEIIEVAVIKYDLTKPTKTHLGTEVGEYARLTKPSQKLTDQITAITGITGDMVKDKKPFTEHINALQEFIGEHLIFAHNANFDIGYLTHHGLVIKQPVWDTFPLAGIAWPEAPSYNLGTLAAQLDIKVQGEHRAGDDVRLTWELLNRAQQELHLQPDYYQEMIKLLEGSGQSQYLPLFSSIKQSVNKYNKPKERKEQHAKAEIGMASVLGPDGLLESEIPNFKHRPEQVAMAKAVQDSIKEQTVTMIEAGTGTGKTFAYLIPLIISSIEGQTAVISTHTKNLQDQLSQHDLPKLLNAMSLDISTAVLKGRRNYLCITRLWQALGRARHKPDEAMLLIKLLNWLDKGGEGDLERFNVSHQGAHLLHHLHADAISCRLVCAKERPECPYQQARKRASEADIVVINHALLMQLGSDDSILSINSLVIDEAHHLEPTAREASRRDLSEHRVAEAVAPFVQLAKEDNKYHHVKAEAEHILVDYQGIRSKIIDYVKNSTAGESVRLTSAIRQSGSWQKIMQAATDWRARVQFLVGLVEGMTFDNDQTRLIKEAVLEAESLCKDIIRFIEGDTTRIQWIEYDETEQSEHTVNLQDVALVVVDDIATVTERAQSVVITSATLTTEGKYSYIKGRIGLENAKEIRLGSPFAYQDQMLIYIADDGLSPTNPDFDRFTASILSSVAETTSGRILGLFTSHQSIRNVYHTVVKKFNKIGIPLYAQKLTGGRHNIVNRFKNIERSVLLGTNSFWEGIDIPGEGLSSILIPRLPFQNPNDPVQAAVSEHEKLNTFIQLSLPDMIIRLQQGIGRLIRTTEDHGVVIILDGRFLNQEYGKKVLDSLPPATIHIGSHHDISDKITDWFGAEKITTWQQESQGNRP